MKHYKNKAIKHIPSIGIAIFIILYIYAATLYPGGSQANLNSEGFDWVHNYWCNLMNEKGMNRADNPARPFSITAMIILCLSFMVFFIRFGKKWAKNTFWSQTIQISGSLSMFFAMLIFTAYHDLMTMISSFFGLFVVIGIIRSIYTSPLTYFKITGLACLILLALNNYIYYSTHWIVALPLIQKITFLVVLLWVISLNYNISTISEDN